MEGASAVALLERGPTFQYFGIRLIMRITVSTLRPEFAEVVLEGVDTDMVNVIRHGLYQDVPVLAVDYIDFHEYDGDIPSSNIAHRIGQLPLRFTDGKAPEDETRSTATLSIDFVTSGVKPRLQWITSMDVTCKDGSAEVVHYRSPEEAARASRDTGFKLCPLQTGQRFRATLHARVDTARKHTRWNSILPIVCPIDDTTFRLKIHTTGAITAEAALKHVLKMAATRFRSASAFHTVKPET